MTFHLSPDIELPGNAATSTFAVLGTRGSGKTYGAGVMIEEFLGARVQVVVIDPVGVWWALRISADGAARGFDIPVFGGIHGDIPLEPTAGELVAHLVVEQRVSLVLDVSDFTDGQQRRFVEAFSRTFFQLKKRNKYPTHLVFEEAHEFFPQLVDSASAPMVGATKRLWKVGRNYGIGGTLISTRAAEINKNALNITDRIITGRLTAPEDVKRIKDWASSNGVNAEQVAALTSMPKGKLIVWRDAGEGGAVVTTFRKKLTFDASRTPESVDGEVCHGLPAVDLGAIRIAMAATIEETKANDPKELRAEVSRLRNELATAPGRAEMVGRISQDAVKLAEERDTWRRQSEQAEKLLAEMRAAFDGASPNEIRRLRTMEDDFNQVIDAVDHYQAWNRERLKSRRLVKLPPELVGDVSAPDGHKSFRVTLPDPQTAGLMARRLKADPAYPQMTDDDVEGLPPPRLMGQPFEAPDLNEAARFHLARAGLTKDPLYPQLTWDDPATIATSQPRKGWTAMEEDLYQKFKARLIEEVPGLLKVLAIAPEMQVTIERQVIEIDGSKSLKGRVARLLADGFLDTGKKNGEIVRELGRTGPTTNSIEVSKVMKDLIAMGFIHNTDGGRFILAPGAKVNIKR